LPQTGIRWQRSSRSSPASPPPTMCTTGPVRTARLSRATTNNPDGRVGPVPLGAGPTAVVDQAAKRAAPAAATPGDAEARLRRCSTTTAVRGGGAGPIRAQRCPVCLSGWPIVAGGPLRARPRPALTLRAFGSRTFPDRAPLRVTGKTSSPNLALHGPYTGPQLHYQKADKNKWQHPSNRSCTNQSGGGEMTARLEILGTEYKQLSQTPREARSTSRKQRISSLEGEFATRDNRSTKADRNKNSQEIVG
jgi:hypothetical protein